jgi:hypothetical protein
MQLSKTALAALLVAASFIISTAQAGTIACLNGQLNGGVGQVPVHNPEFSINGQTFIGGPFSTDCGEMVGAAADPNSKYEGGDGSLSAMATFWITSDTCMNIMTGGNHYFCCPGKINQGSDDITTCTF